jgi:hypothetical protein
MNQNVGGNACRPEHLFRDTRAPALTLWTDCDITGPTVLKLVRAHQDAFSAAADINPGRQGGGQALRWLPGLDGVVGLQ